MRIFIEELEGWKEKVDSYIQRNRYTPNIEKKARKLHARWKVSITNHPWGCDDCGLHEEYGADSREEALIIVEGRLQDIKDHLDEALKDLQKLKDGLV